MKNNIGILIFGDPTRGGTITSETKFLANLYEQNSQDCEFFVLTVNPTITKKVIRDRKSSYNFPWKNIQVFGEEDFHKLDNLSCIVTYPGHSNFFGGYLNDNIVKLYKIVSKCTNELDIPVFIRINDSEIKVRDYRKMCKVRLDDGVNKPESAFMKDPVNVAKANDLVKWKEWDYSKIFWFANGSREACDWVAETMFDREDEVYRMASRQTFVDNAIYVSDDIFFLIRKNYDRLLSRYEDQHGFINDSSVAEKLCYIGFFDTVNMARAKAFSVLFKENTHKVPLKIFGKGTEILTKLKGKTNIEIEEGFIKGDSDEYFDFLHGHLAYIFVGKGQTTSRYIGKTVYDAIVARTPILVYKKCDQGHITFSSDEFYFENEFQLHSKFEQLKDPKTRDRWIHEQSEEIFKKLPPSGFKFSDYCECKSPIDITENIENESIKIVSKKTPETNPKVKSIELF